MDFPQVLLLKINRIAEYFDEVTSIYSDIFAQVVVASESDRKWIRNVLRSEVIVDSLIQEAKAANEDFLDNILTGLFGVAVCFIPVVGPTIGGAMLGYGIGSEIDRRNSLKRINKFAEFPQLLRMPIAVEQFLITSTLVEEFFRRQKEQFANQELKMRLHLYAVSEGKEKVRLLGGPEKARFPFLRYFSSPPKLKSLNCS
jgi:hypothetical protein